MPALDHAHFASCSCLVATDGAPVPLTSVELTGEVFGAHARVVLRQRYENVEPRPIEAIYTFPVPAEAALVGFAMECAGRRLEAEVKERDEAFAAYDEAVGAGHGAALLDEERRNVFTASVGNLLPGEETIVEVVYVQALRADEGALRLVVPTVVAPRYVPGRPSGDRTGHGAADPTDRV
ncbi:MAG TPA: VIT domain-containing protein, partial [Minicystis sp.]|nr:VIT domain-containing protein [Minicystis sp.]